MLLSWAMSVVEVEITQQKAVYNDYSLERKAEVLAMVQANGGNVDRTAGETGIAHQTIRYWLTNAAKYSQIQSQKVVDLADQCEADARYYFALARDKAPDAPYNHLMTGAAIATDKMQLLRGQPTSITADLSANDLTIILAGALGEALDLGEDGPSGPETINVTLEP